MPTNYANYEEFCEGFGRRLDTMLKAAKAGQKGMQPAMEILKAEYTLAKAQGIVKFADIFDIYLRALQGWINRAEKGTP